MLKNNSILYKILILLILVFTCSIAFMLLNLAIVYIAGLLNVNVITNINFLKTLQVVYQLLAFLLPVLIFYKISGYSIVNDLGFKREENIKVISFIILLYVVTIPLINWTTEVNSNIALPNFLGNLKDWFLEQERQATELTFKFLSTNNILGVIANILVLALVPAVTEELLFRGCIQRILTENVKLPHLGVIVSALIFSFAHMQFDGFIPRFILGLILGYIFFYTRNIKLSMLFHFINNFVAVLIAYIGINYYNYSPQDLNSSTEFSNFYLALLSIVFIVFIIRFIYKNANRQSQITE